MFPRRAQPHRRTPVNRPRSVWMRAVAILVLLMGGRGAEAVEAVPEAATFRAYRRPVTTWIAPYAVAKSKTALEAQPAMRESLTHLALQFWVPTAQGGVERV